MLHGLNFSKLVFLSTLVFTYTNTVPLIFTFFNARDLYSRCAAHTQTDSDVTFSTSCDKGKITKMD